MNETTLAVIDGYLVDDAGEIHGHTNCADEFHVVDQSSAEWVLAKMMDADAAISAVNAKEKVILENLRLERLHQQQRRQWFEFRFGPELKAYARANLRGKSKTWTCPYGKVAFRATQPALDITDESAAIAWVKSLGLTDAVKTTETLLISECKEKLLADPPPLGHGIDVVPAGEKVTIKSGVE